jgi:hypothetical protein
MSGKRCEQRALRQCMQRCHARDVAVCAVIELQTEEENKGET